MSYSSPRGILPRDVEKLALSLIRGSGQRRLRLAGGRGSSFDKLAQRALEEAKADICSDIADPALRRATVERVLFSLCERVPYSHMGECCCCENKFYGYRRQLCLQVARRMGFIDL